LFTGCFLVFVIIFSLIMTIITVWAYCKIFHKAGYHWALGLLALVPIANLIIILVLAFGDWPILKELRELKAPKNTSLPTEWRNK
jgi:hypothetical protein